jgi:hypothetical protein
MVTKLSHQYKTTHKVTLLCFSVYFLGTLEKLRKVTIIFFMYVRPSVRPSVFHEI